jgi:CheY-like chemotaxis protein
MLEQVVLNLAVNARDAMPSGGRLLLSTQTAEIPTSYGRACPEARPGSFVELTVQDSGVGIPPEILPRIFEPFFTTKGVGKGTGLGLSTVYGIVKQHEGWIEVFSRPGSGSVFKIFLPLAPEQTPSAASKTEADGGREGGSERILLVEDEDGVRTLTRRMLEKFGYRVQEAASAAEAQQKYHGQPIDFDLLLSDMIMPGGVTGRELAETLRCRKPELKVLFMSGYSGDALGQDFQFLQDSHCHFIPKPCSVRELLKAVRQCLEEPARSSVACP